jgi:hypothetical protein
MWWVRISVRVCFDDMDWDRERDGVDEDVVGVGVCARDFDFGSDTGVDESRGGRPLLSDLCRWRLALVELDGPPPFPAMLSICPWRWRWW